ncbi:MAG: hypothetical protein KIT09_31740 [Bryobacteraceae bacterium]|nr:hypothetical protein [Bryobacteraceae bacterium]
MRSNATYVVKVSGRLAPVKILRESPYGGWVGRNERTGREVRIRSAAKLRQPYRTGNATAFNRANVEGDASTANREE